jgi:hypothetical protein
MKNFYQQWLESKSNSIAMKDTIRYLLNKWGEPENGYPAYAKNSIIPKLGVEQKDKSE